MTPFMIGTAGWSIARRNADSFPEDGGGLERYAARFSVVEINSSFHRAHRLTTWERWRDSVPADFRFSVKVPKRITHEQKLIDCSEALDQFFGEATALREKLAVVLVQLPPKQEFDAKVSTEFFTQMTARSGAQLVCEPRNLSWFTAEADALLDSLRVARVAADPAICAEAAGPGGWNGLAYRRLHGSPVKYRSSYVERIQTYAEELRREAALGAATWCIFDNTASSAATGDALALQAALDDPNLRGTRFDR